MADIEDDPWYFTETEVYEVFEILSSDLYTRADDTYHSRALAAIEGVVEKLDKMYICEHCGQDTRNGGEHGVTVGMWSYEEPPEVTCCDDYSMEDELPY